MKIAVLMLCFSFFGINIGKEPVVQEEKAVYEPYEIYMRNEREKAPLEKNTCMSGAYIKEENIFSDIKAFEEKTGVNNDIYVYYLRQGDNFPKSDIIQCYAKGKIPMLIIEGNFGSSQIESIAEICGNLDISMFVEINSQNKYIYECFAELFRKSAPKAVLVYGINSSDTKFDLPDEKLVDWVSINVDEKTSGSNIISEYENTARLCNYYSKKAVILNIKVPNFSIEKCSYIYNEAANEISALYSLALDYNNIGVINYISCVEKYENIINYNYRITENDILISAYKIGVLALSSDRYWFRTPYIAYVSEKNTIVNKDTADILKLNKRFINSGFYEIKPEGFNKSERKVFVKS